MRLQLQAELDLRYMSDGDFNELQREVMYERKRRDEIYTLHINLNRDEIDMIHHHETMNAIKSLRGRMANLSLLQCKSVVDRYSKYMV